MVQCVEFFVAGRPAPQGSKRYVGQGRMVESSKYVKPWRRSVAVEAARCGGGVFEGPVAVRLVFVLPRPSSERVRFTRPHVRRPDVDKLSRAVLDGVTGPLLGDDSHVVTLCAGKRTALPGETPGVFVQVSDAVGVFAGLSHSTESIDPEYAQWPCGQRLTMEVS